MFDDGWLIVSHQHLLNLHLVSKVVGDQVQINTTQVKGIIPIPGKGGAIRAYRSNIILDNCKHASESCLKVASFTTEN